MKANVINNIDELWEFYKDEVEFEYGLDAYDFFLDNLRYYDYTYSKTEIKKEKHHDK